jgi:hypothetical protein
MKKINVFIPWTVAEYTPYIIIYFGVNTNFQIEPVIKGDIFHIPYVVVLLYSINERYK